MQPTTSLSRQSRRLKFYKQAPRISALVHVKRLYIKALQCGIVFEEKRVKWLFVKGMDESICNNMRIFLKQHPHAPSTELASYADMLIRTADRSAKTSESSKYKPTRSTVRPARSYAHAAITSDDNELKSTLEAAPKYQKCSHDNKHQSDTSASCDKSSYCHVSLAKTYSELQCLY